VLRLASMRGKNQAPDWGPPSLELPIDGPAPKPRPPADDRPPHGDATSSTITRVEIDLVGTDETKPQVPRVRRDDAAPREREAPRDDDERERARGTVIEIDLT
jgi:hypothetical protein